MRVQIVRTLVIEEFGNLGLQLFDLQVKLVGLVAHNLETIRVLRAIGLGEFCELFFSLLQRLLMSLGVAFGPGCVNCSEPFDLDPDIRRTRKRGFFSGHDGLGFVGRLPVDGGLFLRLNREMDEGCPQGSFGHFSCRQTFPHRMNGLVIRRNQRGSFLSALFQVGFKLPQFLDSGRK